MSRHDLPPKLSRRWGHLPYIRKRGRSEWSSACPQCGEVDHDPSSGTVDRFRMFDDKPGFPAGGWCRACTYFDWTDSDQSRPSEEERTEMDRQRRKMALAERRRIGRLIDKVRREAEWRVWHQALDAKRRQLWHTEGIGDEEIDRYELGYCSDLEYLGDSGLLHSPTLTIPVWRPEGVVNVQHRLLNPNKGDGKYRQIPNLPAASFLAEPDNPLTGRVFVVEGAKKAIVLQTILTNMKSDITTVGWPSCHPNQQAFNELEWADIVYLGLDPGLDSDVVDAVAKKVRVVDKRVIDFPVKPDDMVVKYGATGTTILRYIDDARRV